MEVERMSLPGIGLQHILTTHRGARIGVISLRSGQRDLLLYDPHDPDTTILTLALAPEEAEALAELLSTPRVIERLAEMERQATGLVSEQIPITTESPYATRTLGDTKARTRTGASIVAVVREREVFASPRPDFRFQPGDVVLAIGTAEGARALASLLANG